MAPTQKLVYNAQGQLSELRDAANVLVAKYVYRGDGKRAWKEGNNGTRSYFYYAGEQMIALSNGTNASTLLLWGADCLIGTRSSVSGTLTKRYHLYDTQGNLAQTLDENGAVVSQSAVSAWGEPLRDGAGNLSGGGYGAKFGYWRDGESGFVLCTLRYYDPSGGRWITRDPIGYAGGSNLYGYVDGDPVNAVDPSGLAPMYSPVNSTSGTVGGNWDYHSKRHFSRKARSRLDGSQNFWHQTWRSKAISHPFLFHAAYAVGGIFSSHPIGSGRKSRLRRKPHGTGTGGKLH